MNDSERSESGRSLIRDLAVLLLLGIALGFGFNQVQRASGSSRALPWFAKEKTLAKLEDSGAVPAPTSAAVVAPAASSTTPASATPATSSAPAAKEAPAKTDAPMRPMPSSPGSDFAPPPASPPAASRPGKRPDVTDGPATAAPRATVPALPVIPDSDEPREAGYATIQALHTLKAALFVDARSAEEYAEAHIPGAVNLSFDEVFRKPDLVKSIDSGGRPIVTYCGGGDCELSKSLAFAFIEAGHRKVLVFMAGLPGWKAAGNEVTTGARP